MASQNDSALAHLRELLPIREFALRVPTVYASHDPVQVLGEHQVVYLDVRPAAWPVQEAQFVIATRELVRPGLVAGLLEGGMAIVGFPQAIYRHLRDEATVRFWLGSREGLARQAIAVSQRLTGLARGLRAVVA